MIPTTDPPNAGGPISRLANAAAPALILLAPFVGFIRYQGYDLLRPELLASVAILAGLGLAISGLIALRSETLRPTLIALLLLLCIDVQTRTETAVGIRELMGWEILAEYETAALTAAVLVLTLSLMIVTWLLRRHLGLIISASFGVIVLTSLLLPSETIPAGEIRNRPVTPKANLPVVLHIVLDGQIGPAGLPRNIPGANELRREMEELYAEYGFTVFGRAYSSYYATYESLSNLLIGRMFNRFGANIEAVDGHVPKAGIRLRENIWFRQLSEQGYRIRAYHTEFLDFCSPEGVNIDYCFVSPANGIRSLMGAELAWGTKTRLILGTFLSGSLIYRIATRKLRATNAEGPARGKLPQWPWRQPWLGPLEAASILERIARDLQIASQGTAFFAHILIPHGSFMYGPDCRLRNDLLTWRSELNPDAPKTYSNTPNSRKASYERYFEQMRCVNRKLAALFDKMQELDIFEDATIIVHGDHGSRIASIEPKEINADRVTEADLMDSYSTLFAARVSGLTPGYNAEQRSIQGLFGELFLGLPSSDRPEQVFLRTKNKPIGTQLIGIPMPRLGQ